VAAIVVGLGNPGPEYAATRHNVGRMVVAVLADRCGVALSGHKGNARAASARLPGSGGVPGPAVVLAEPLSYMNLSGGPVAALLRYHKATPADLVVVHDDIDLPFGTVRLKRGGGEGGHNGLRDITKAVGTADYVRVRVGVGRPPGSRDAADHVLRGFTGAERRELDLVLAEAADAVEAILTEGLDAAQQRFHTAG
jgi:PTH1 family peptidyl-tRNA hydrolase